MVAVAQVDYNQSPDRHITTHVEDPNNPGKTFCTGQPFADYSNTTFIGKRHKVPCTKCLKEQKRQNQLTFDI